MPDLVSFFLSPSGVRERRNVNFNFASSGFVQFKSQPINVYPLHIFY